MRYALATEPAGDVQVRQHRQVRIAADLVVKSARDQEALIAIGSLKQPAADGGYSLQQTRSDTFIIDGEAKGCCRVAAPAGLDTFDELTDLALPARLQLRVGLQEEEPRET